MSRLPRIQQLDCGSLNDFAIGAFRQIMEKLHLAQWVPLAVHQVFTA